MGELFSVHLTRQEQFMSLGRRLFSEMQRRGFRQIALRIQYSNRRPLLLQGVLQVRASHKMTNYHTHP